jgi:hypothetical protein
VQLPSPAEELQQLACLDHVAIDAQEAVVELAAPGETVRSRILVGFDTRLANDVAIFLILLLQESSERCAAQSSWVEILSDEL